MYFRSLRDKRKWHCVEYMYVTASCGFMGSFRLKCTDGNPSLDLSHTNPFNYFYPTSW
jgi:hypothetical protein